MPSWLALALLATLIYGVWSIILKLAVDRLGSNPTLYFHSLTFAAAVLLYKWTSGFRVPIQTTGVALAVVAGALSMVGTVFFLAALGKGRASVVVPLAALYPAITVLLSLLILKEHLTGAHWLGVAFALAAVVLLSR